jgi:alkanesulfonate monooxygenase SsuD/methylene tetrahydromethanopterin reductase-like flavin-dependent oxidoreductase (luciferase family)
MTVELGVILPTSTPDPANPIIGDVRASARLAEELGLDSVWSTDHLVASAPMLDSTSVLATAAAVTERIKIGYNVLLLSLRPVAWAAKQVSTLQILSGNRLVLGVGTGNPAHGDVAWRASGLSYDDRGARTDAALEVLPDLIAGKTAVVENGVSVAIAPGAVVPPIVVAGNGKRALRRVARFADGWASIGLSPDEVAAGLAEIDRPAVKATIVAPSVGSDPKAAAELLAEYEAVGVERVILAPTGPDFHRDYEFAAAIKAAG